jgi:hypothetical protein
VSAPEGRAWLLAPFRRLAWSAWLPLPYFSPYGGVLIIWVTEDASS